MEQAEKRWDARVGRALDLALPHELNPKAQWVLLRGFGLQLRDTYGAALCVSLHHPNTKGDQRNAHGHIFMTCRVVDEDGDFSKTKIRSLDDRKLGPVEVGRIREMWEVRCNRALRKAGFSENVTRHSLKAQVIDRPATQHLGSKAVAMTRNGCRPRKAETNREILRIPPHGGDRKSTPTPQNPCPSSLPQTIRSPANPRRCEVKSGSSERPASIHFQAQNLRPAARRITDDAVRTNGDRIS